jgi:hypothetical protein
MSTSLTPVPIREAEVLVVPQKGPGPLEATAGHGVLAGVEHGHPPGLGVGLVHLHLVLGHVEGDVRHVEEVVGEVLLDHVAAVAEADDEVVDARGRVDLEDVPEDRPVADLHHRLGLEV